MRAGARVFSLVSSLIAWRHGVSVGEEQRQRLKNSDDDGAGHGLSVYIDVGVAYGAGFFRGGASGKRSKAGILNTGFAMRNPFLVRRNERIHIRRQFAVHRFSPPPPPRPPPGSPPGPLVMRSFMRSALLLRPKSRLASGRSDVLRMLCFPTCREHAVGGSRAIAIFRRFLLCDDYSTAWTARLRFCWCFRWIFEYTLKYIGR